MLSVIIPCFNRELLSARTIQSLGKFSADSLEIIVVDDGSTDGSVPVAKQALEALSSVGIKGSVLEGEHRGACAARNLGLRESRGEWILFLDSDDPAEAEGLNRLSQATRSDGAPDIVYGWVWVVKEGSPDRWRKGTPIEKCRNLVFDHPWHTSAAIYRRSVLSLSGEWNEALTLGDDWEFGARARLATDKIHYEDTCVGYYVQHGHERLSAQSFERSKSRSVIRAVLRIRRAARQRGRLDADLQRRIHRRLLVQGAELVVFANDPRGKAVIAACAGQSHDKLTAVLAIMFQAVPMQGFRKWIYGRLRAKGLA